MRKLAIGEILNKAGGLPTLKKQVEFLQEQRSPALIHLLALCLDPRARFDLPDGPTPVDPKEQQTDLYQEAKRLYIYLKPPLPGEAPFQHGGHVSQIKKETLWMQLLAALSPNDRETLDAIKDKKLPFCLKEAPVVKAFPELDFSYLAVSDGPVE